MSNSSQTTWQDWIGADVVDDSGSKVGTLENVFMDRATGEPEWLAVKTGMFGSRSTFVPLEGVDSDGAALRVPYAKSLIKDAPNVDDSDEYLTPEEEARLYQHYGRQGYQEWDETRDADVVGTVGRDTSGPTTDTAMTRSEEELQVGKQEREAGRARLRKYVVTENVSTTVPVRKERARVTREPITDANVGKAMDGPEISEEEHEITLTEEEAVVSKQAVPKERVRLDKETVETQEQVGGEVRKEQIEVEGDTDTTR